LESIGAFHIVKCISFLSVQLASKAVKKKSQTTDTTATKASGKEHGIERIAWLRSLVGLFSIFLLPLPAAAENKFTPTTRRKWATMVRLPAMDLVSFFFSERRVRCCQQCNRQSCRCRVCPCRFSFRKPRLGIAACSSLVVYVDFIIIDFTVGRYSPASGQKCWKS
jgi:hypothetical protein